MQSRPLIVKEDESRYAELINSSRFSRSISGKKIEASSVFVQVKDFKSFSEFLFHKFELVREVYEKKCPAKKSFQWIKDDTIIPSVLRSVTCGHCSAYCVPLRVKVPFLEKRSSCFGAKGSCYTLIFKDIAMAYYYKRP